MTTLLAGAAAGGGLWLLYQIAKSLEELNKRMKRMNVVIEEMNDREKLRDFEAKYRDVKVTWTEGIESDNRKEGL